MAEKKTVGLTWHKQSDFFGVIIRESLENPGVLKKVKILKTRIEPVTKRHKTPWVKKWTLHTVRIPEHDSDKIARELSKSLDSVHPWYADFKNEKFHYIIFRNKIFKIDVSGKNPYDKPVKYGISIGIPKYQLNFSPDWKKNPDRL